MNINTGLVKEMISLFVDLNEDYQRKAIGYMYKLLLEQNAEESVTKELLKTKEAYTDYKKNELIKSKLKENSTNIFNLLKLVDTMDDTGKASMMLFIEKLKPGSLSQKDEISITINSKEIGIEDFLKSYLPNADYQIAKDYAYTSYDNVKNKINQKSE